MARLNPRKADLQRWRETFAEKLRERGIDAEATRQATRRPNRSYEASWRIKAREDGRLRSDGSASRTKSSARAQATRAEAVEAWEQVARALAASGDEADQDLAQSITKFFKDMLALKMLDRTVRTTEIAPPSKSLDVDQRR